jgi:transposase
VAVAAQWQATSREELERETERLRQENERLRRELERTEREREQIEREREQIERERDRLREERDRLEKELEAARRAAKRQAAPFSKGAPSPRPRRPGRKPGRAYGPRAWRPVPDHVDEVVEVLPPAACAACGGAVGLERVDVQYQADLPPVRPHVTAFHVHVGRCRRCGRRVHGRDARQTSTATGAAASQVGPRALAWAAWLHTGLGVPFAKVATILRTGFGLTMTAGGLVQALHRMGRRSAPTYHALVAVVRRSPVVAPDETGWKVGARLWWLWVFVTRDVTVYAIQPGRGYTQAASILGARYGGILVRDGWAPYRKLPRATHQTCLAHLLRRCHALLELAQRGAARFPHAVRRILLAALAIRERRDAGRLVGRGLAVAIGRLEARTDRLLAGHVTHPPNRRLLQHLRTERPALFTCLRHADVDATNWQAEQAIRPAVVTRKVCGGNRTPRGADTQQMVASVLRTCWQQQRDPLALLVALQCSPHPVVADLRLPGPDPP